MDRLEAALNYAARYGWKIVPLRGREKGAWLDAWPTEASDDPELIRKWFTDRPQSNLGVQLGPRSGIIDFEGDEQGSEEDFLKLFDNDVPVCPTFASKRGKHRLFKYRDDLPGLAKVNVGKVEIRIGGGGKGNYSVLPPSVHPSGEHYRWLVSPEEVDPPPLPDAVVTKIWNQQGGALGSGETVSRPPEDWERIAAGVPQGSRNDSAAAWIGRDVAGRKDVVSEPAVKAAWDAAVGWNRANQPPLEEKELEVTFKSILGRERRKRLSEEPEAAPVQSGDAPRPGWRLEIVLSEPRRYRLYSEFWEGFVTLNSEQYFNPKTICVLALEQRQVALRHKRFQAIWQGSKGSKHSLQEMLVEHAVLVPAGADSVRSAVVAERILEFLNNAYPLPDNGELDERGAACRLDDGRYVFKFTRLLESVSREADRIRRNELVDLLAQVGAGIYRPPGSRGMRRTRLHMLTPTAVALLSDLVNKGVSPHAGV